MGPALTPLCRGLSRRADRSSTNVEWPSVFPCEGSGNSLGGAQAHFPLRRANQTGLDQREWRTPWHGPFIGMQCWAAMVCLACTWSSTCLSTSPPSESSASVAISANLPSTRWMSDKMTLGLPTTSAIRCTSTTSLCGFLMLSGPVASSTSPHWRTQPRGLIHIATTTRTWSRSQG